MKKILNKQKFFKLVFVIWIILWLFFLVREDKEGQYKSLGYLYTHSHNEAARYIMGGELYDFLAFCKDNIPEGSTYQLEGFEEFSINKVRSRYFLWPLRSVEKGADFKIVYGGSSITYPDYEEYKVYNNIGQLLVRKDRI